MHVENHGIDYKSAFKVTMNKALRMWPYYLVGFFSVFISTMIFKEKVSALTLRKKLFYAIPNMFYLSWSINGVAWYVSTMLTVGLIILFFLSVNKEAVVFCIASLCIHYIYWELYCALPSLQNFQSYTFSKLIQDCYFRAAAGMLLGVVAGYTYNSLKNKESHLVIFLNRKGVLIGNAGIALALLLICRKPEGLMEYICIGIFFLSIICLFVCAGGDICLRKG